MTRTELLATVRNTLADVLDDDSVELTEASTAGEVEDWDSINHVRLLIGLEKVLNVRFASDEVQGLANVGALMDVLERKLRA